MIPATISAVRQATPTVKVFTLDTDGLQMEYQPGQWLDFYVEVDGTVEVGGYSMTSSPLTKGSIELAIKYSAANPVTRHLHERARVGDEVILDGGQGACYYEAGMAQSLTLIAGGIGITPIMSIIRYAREATPEVPVTLLYSAPSVDEHLYREELEELAAAREGLQCEFWVTRDGTLQPGTVSGRISEARLSDAAGDAEALYFVCGPPSMIDDVVQVLIAQGVPESGIRFERWW
jgi:ferredoxin-NADP reductase